MQSPAYRPALVAAAILLDFGVNSLIQWIFRRFGAA